MPFVGLGLHVLIAIFFAVHALKTGREMYWLFVLFSFPMLGSVVYFLAIYLPSSRLERGAQRVLRSAAKALDPTRELRQAQSALEQAPTAQNQIRLAEALLNKGQHAQASELFEACLKGPFAADPHIRWLAARAQLANGQSGLALQHVQAIRAEHPTFRPEEVAVTMAQSLAAQGDLEGAHAEFDAAVRRFGSVTVLAEYAIWCHGLPSQRERDTAARLQTDIAKATKHWNRHARVLNADVLQRLKAAQKASTPA